MADVKNPMFLLMQRLDDTTQMISRHLAGELNVPYNVFASRGTHSGQVAMLCCSVESVLPMKMSDNMWQKGMLHDGGQRVLGHQSEEFFNNIVKKYKLNRAVRHEQNIERSLLLSGLKPDASIIEAAEHHSGERKVYSLRPGEPVEGAIVSLELKINREELVYDIAPLDAEDCILRICDPLCHIRNDFKTLVKLGFLKDASVPTNEEIILSFINNSNFDADDTVVAISKSLFDNVIELRYKVEGWQKSEPVIKLRQLEQKLLQYYWDIKLEEFSKQFGDMKDKALMEKVIDNMNIITETQLFEVLEAHGVYKRKILA